MIVKGDKKEMISGVQFYLDEELNLPQAVKIISILVSSRVSSVEPMSGEAKVNYKVCYKVIYRTAEGIECLEENYDHTAEIKSPSITPKSYVAVTANVIAKEFVGLNKLKIRCTMELSGYVVREVNVDSCDAIADVYTKTTAIDVESIESLKSCQVVASLDIEIKEGVEKVLTYDSQICIKNVTTAAEICQIDGECYTYITYISNGSLCSRCINIPFDGECLQPNVKEGMAAYCIGTADSTTVTLMQGVGSNAVKVEVVVDISGYFVAVNPVDVTMDAYSNKNELQISREEVTLQDNICIKGSYEKFNGSIRLDEDKARVRSVLCVCPPSVGAISVTNNNGLQVDGIISASIIYLDEEEKTEEALAEIPYSFTLGRDFTCSENLVAKAVVTNIYARVRHNDEIDVIGDVFIEVSGTMEKPIEYIKCIELAGEREASEVAISLYIVRSGEMLFDVAKALMSDEETLLNLNPDLTLPLKGGEKVLLYRGGF